MNGKSQTRPSQGLRQSRFLSKSSILQNRISSAKTLSFNPWHALPEHRPLGVTTPSQDDLSPHRESRHRLNSVARRVVFGKTPSL